MTDEPDETEEPTEEELFPAGSLPGDDLNRQTVFKKNLPTTLVVSISKAAVPIRGAGLVNPGRFGRALITYLPSQLHELPLREDKDDPAKVTGLKLTQDLRAVFVTDANDAAGLIRSEFEVLAAEDTAAAVALLAELREMAPGLRAVG